MTEIITIIICLITIILLKFALGVNFKELKTFKSRGTKELEMLPQKFPNNKEICSKILKIKNKSDVIIEEQEEYNSCLYMIFNNKIVIGKFQQEYMKIQTIAHECIHSCQNKFTLWFNFIFTNIYLFYFVVISIHTIFNKVSSSSIYLITLIFMSFIQYIVRYSLEIDAMQNARYLAQEYILNENILNENEKEILLNEYDSVNKIAIPVVNFELIYKNIIKIVIYSIICLI